MLKIGEFSILTRISIYMLRHYNEIGLLIPAYIDETTGYRYYREEQLPAANRLQALKSMGMSLEMIKKTLTQWEDTEGLKNTLSILSAKKKEEIKRLQSQLLTIETALENIDHASCLSVCSIAVKEIPERYAACCRGLLREYNQEGILWDRLNEELVKQHVQPANPQFNTAALFSDIIAGNICDCNPENNPSHIDSDRRIDVEVQKAVIGKYRDTEDIKFKTIKPVTVAALTYQGGYYRLQEVNEAIAKWIADNNFELEGNIFNIYHTSPETESLTDNLITEVCFPIIIRKELQN